MDRHHQLDPARLGDHLDRLYRAAWGLCGSREEAEDLVQDTYARVLARPRFIRGEEDLAYLIRVLRNTFISQRRAAARRPVSAPGAEEFDVPEGRSSVQPAAAAEVNEVYTAIARLPEEFRLALIAIDVAGLSYREAARALRAPEGTVTSRLYRARAQVARELRGPEDADVEKAAGP
jgi:RNA polymerase sigma-70 factor (ECF subfamily)